MPLGHAATLGIVVVPWNRRQAEGARQGRRLVGIEDHLDQSRVLVEDRDPHVRRSGDEEVDVVGRRGIAREDSRLGADRDDVPGTAELGALVPGGTRGTGKEFLGGMDAVRAATDERDRGNGEPLAQSGAPIPAAGDDLWGTRC